MPNVRILRPVTPSMSAATFAHEHASSASGATGGATNRRRVRLSSRLPSRAVPRIDSAVPDEITCLIADDHEVVREGLRLSLLRSPHIRIVGEAPDGETAVALAERRRPDVVIMDLRMPGMDGLEATEEIVKRVPDTRVLVFTAYSERSLLARGLESGARATSSRRRHTSCSSARSRRSPAARRSSTPP